MRARALLFSLIAALGGFTRVHSGDVLFHLASGRLIRELGSVPAVDTLSFSARGAPWHNHSWLFERVLAAIDAGAGLFGVALLQVGLLIALGSLALRRAVVPNGVLAPLALCAAATIGFREVINARPQLFALTALAASIALVREVFAHPERRASSLTCWAAGLLTLHAAWVLSHGSHLLLLLLLALAAAFAARAKQWRPAIFFAVSLVAAALDTALLTPGAAALASEHVQSPVLERFIGEWGPADAGFLFRSAPGLVFCAAAWLGLAGCASSLFAKPPSASAPPSGNRAFDLACLLLMAAIALTAKRMTALFVLGSLPLWLPYACSALSQLHARLGPRARVWQLGAASLLAAALVWTMVGASDKIQLGYGLARGRFPERAVSWLRERGIDGRFFHAYAWGGYLMYMRYPTDGVFIDGRAITVYSEAFFTEYFLALTEPARFESLASKHQLRGVLLPVAQLPEPLGRHLLSSDWIPAYRDRTTAVFLRGIDSSTLRRSVGPGR